MNTIRAVLRRHQLGVGLAAGLVIAGALAGTGAAIAAIPSTSTKLINACVHKSTGAVRIIDYQAGRRCVTKTERSVAWGARGATGPAGAPGAPGPKGDTGAPGTARAYARISSDGATVNHSKGNVTAVVITPGVYCVSVQGVDSSTSIAQVQPDGFGDTTNPYSTPVRTSVVEWSSFGGACASYPGSFEVVTYEDAGGTTLTLTPEAFTILVP